MDDAWEQVDRYWDEWADALPSQFLGKQSITMAKKQLESLNY